MDGACTFSLHRLETQIEGSLHRLIIPEPFASALLHFQTITTVVVWIMVIAWCQRSRRAMAGAPLNTTQVNVELQPSTTAATAATPAGLNASVNQEQQDLLGRAFDRCFQLAESKL